MLKEKAVAALGQQSLLLPARIKAALAANDRIKFYLSLLQAALQHGLTPGSRDMDWRPELHRLDLDAEDWLLDLPRAAYLDDGVLVLHPHERFFDRLRSDLATMARPFDGASAEADLELAERSVSWCGRLEVLKAAEGVQPAELEDLTHGDRRRGGSLHILVMDLHKRINGLAASIATEHIDGAHAWQIGRDDIPLVRAFMRGLHRTAPLKFEHPGLDTAVTRDGERLLIQNDIGTNDAHVLVIEVVGNEIRLTYSELHEARFAFFRDMLERLGFRWVLEPPHTEALLNRGKPYLVGHATFTASHAGALLAALEATASRIVFVIDWNRAFKRLQLFVGKPVASGLLAAAADGGYGHMAWLLAGGEQLVFGAMQAVDSQSFRIGDRLDQVIGESAAREFLAALLQTSSETLRSGQPVSALADRARVLLARALRQRSFEFELLAEHAAWCHALAETLVAAIGAGGEPARVGAERARELEHRADQLVAEARTRAVRQGRWEPMARLLSAADDIADALEEASFVLSLAATVDDGSLPGGVHTALERLAQATLSAIQDYVRVVEIARRAGSEQDAGDSEAFLQIVWQMLRAERQCDDLFRQTRILAARELQSRPVAWNLVNEIAAAIERATDALLVVGHGLRNLIFARTAQA
jgi:uncharacterized protein Yka (UPF0111/DUF47 family)